MSKKKPLSHYVPKFSNKYWADSSSFTSYIVCEYTKKVKTVKKGKSQWGRQRGLYTWEIEHSLDKEIETKVAPIYEKLTSFNTLNKEEKNLWAQFILSQLVRTPSYIQYEKKGCELTEIKSEPIHDRVGCSNCLDLNFIVNRNWLLLKASDDFLIRTDNPVLQTGFIELPSSYIIYPITPSLCFVACPMDENWQPYKANINPIKVYEMPNGWANMVNFYLARSAHSSLITHPKHTCTFSEHMFKDVIGTYPQPPFSLHAFEMQTDAAYESIRTIMSITDELDYPKWEVERLIPNYT